MAVQAISQLNEINSQLPFALSTAPHCAEQPAHGHAQNSPHMGMHSPAQLNTDNNQASNIQISIRVVAVLVRQ